MHRKADPRDRRGVLVHVTDRGLALRRKLSEQIEAEELLGEATDEQVAALAGRAGRPDRALALTVTVWNSSARKQSGEEVLGEMDKFPQDYELFELGDVTLQHGACCVAHSLPTRRSAS